MAGPACNSAAVASGRYYSEDYGDVFSPRYFGRVYGLTLEDAEITRAGITGFAFGQDEEMPEDWDPDFDAIRKEF